MGLIIWQIYIEILRLFWTELDRQGWGPSTSHLSLKAKFRWIDVSEGPFCYCPCDYHVHLVVKNIWMTCLGYKIAKFSIPFHCRFVCEVCAFPLFRAMGRNSRPIRHKNMAPLAATKITAGVTSGIESCTEAEKCKQQTKWIRHSHRNKTFWPWRIKLNDIFCTWWIQCYLLTKL